MRTLRILNNQDKVLAEANNVVLALNNKCEFVTWLVNYNPNEVSCGHYYGDDIDEAMEAFKVRAFDE